MVNFFKTIAVKLMLIGEPEVDLWDKIRYSFSVIASIGPIAYVLDQINWWFSDNEQFGFFMIVAVIINMIFGMWSHLKRGTFNPKHFLLKNIEMMLIVIFGYTTLDMLRYTAGDNIAGEALKVLFQLSTLAFPSSKIFKNMCIISNGKFPPKFIMQRMYDFEKNGDLSKFFETGIKKEEDK